MNPGYDQGKEVRARRKQKNALSRHQNAVLIKQNMEIFTDLCVVVTHMAVSTSSTRTPQCCNSPYTTGLEDARSPETVFVWLALAGMAAGEIWVFLFVKGGIPKLEMGAIFTQTRQRTKKHLEGWEG
jgi:hypothetical protein